MNTYGIRCTNANVSCHAMTESPFMNLQAISEIASGSRLKYFCDDADGAIDHGRGRFLQRPAWSKPGAPHTFSLPSGSEGSRPAAAFDRCLTRGVYISSAFGRHAYDQTISSCVLSPGGFDFEYGCDGLEMDWSTRVPAHSRMSDLWRHARAAPSPPDT